MSISIELDTRGLQEKMRQYPQDADRALDRIALEWAALAKLAITDMIYSRRRDPKEYRLTGRLRASIVASSPNSPTTTTEKLLDGTTLTLKTPQTPKAAVVGTNVEYARYVHNGTRGGTSRPFLIEPQAEILKYAAEVFAEELP
jgi:hypothetical protein